MCPTHSATRRLACTAACVVAAATLGGCSPAAVVGPRHPLRLVLTEYRMNPDVIRVSAGPLTIVVRNLGRLNHNLAVIQNQQVQAETKPLAPGARTELVVDLVPGTYVMDSTLFSDRALGLYGTLIVVR